MILTSTQLGHFSRYLKQKISIPKVAIIGGYHGGNLGDMALGLAVSNVLKEQGITHGLQTIYNLEKWPNVPYAIVGGGAVGYIDSLLNLYDRYRGKFSKIGFLGVDFNEKNYPENIIQMIREAAFVSCRSSKQAERLMEIPKRDDIYYHPDIAFSLLPEFCENKRKSISDKQKKMFVNVVPLYGTFEKGKIVPNLNYKEERPELYKNFFLMHKNYKISIRNSVKKALDEGYEVESVPFTVFDKEYSEIVLDGLPVKYPVYHSDPIKMLKHISTCEKIISTRYHTTIFGLKTGAALQPIAYAKKNELMLSELGFTPETYLTTTDLASGKMILPKGIVGGEVQLSQWERKSKEMIVQCVKTLLLNN